MRKRELALVMACAFAGAALTTLAISPTSPINAQEGEMGGETGAPEKAPEEAPKKVEKPELPTNESETPDAEAKGETTPPERVLKTLQLDELEILNSAGEVELKIGTGPSGFPNIFQKNDYGEWEPQLDLKVKPFSEEEQAANLKHLDAEIERVAGLEKHDAKKMKVQHVLVAIKGAPRMQGVTRSLEDARQLSADILAYAEKGVSFNALALKFSEDSGPGIYDIEPSTGFVQGFKDVAFKLQVGEIGISPHHKENSPFGFHIIKRLE